MIMNSKWFGAKEKNFSQRDMYLSYMFISNSYITREFCY